MVTVRLVRVLAFACLCVLITLPPARAATVFVDRNTTCTTPDGTSWATAWPTVRQGLDAAESGDEVWVARGTYHENVTLGPGIGLYGGFQGIESERGQRDMRTNPAILDGDQLAPVVTAPSGGVTIDGFTIQNGLGGIMASGGLSTITNNVVQNNATGTGDQRFGGGITCGNGLVADNVVQGNTNAWGGGGISANGSVWILRNVVSHNTSLYNYPYASTDGGGIRVSGSGTVEANSLRSNRSEGYGGGLYAEGTFEIRRNTIAGNEAYSGGGIYAKGSGTIADNVISVNNAHGGGGGVLLCRNIDSPLYQVTLDHNTVTANEATEGGAVYLLWYTTPDVDSAVQVTNNILAFNSSGVTGRTSTQSVFRYNDVFGNIAHDYAVLPNPTGTDGNISVDPRLVSIYKEWHIQPDSPCRDAGDPAYAGDGGTDLDGQPRMQGACVDIGADESDGTEHSNFTRVLHVAPVGDDANDGATWATAKRSVSGALASADVEDEVWVAAGTYYGGISLPAGVGLYGGFAGTENSRSERDWAHNVSILDGEGHGSVVTIRSHGSRIDGFTIQSGTGIDNVESPDGGFDGGGIFCSGSTTICHNTIQNNHVRGNGGGIYCAGSAVEIADNTLLNNEAQGVGGGICLRSNVILPQYTVRNNVIRENRAVTAGGVYCSAHALFLAYNRITDNEAVGGFGGGAGIYRADPTILSNLFARNTAVKDGGGLYLSSSRALVYNNTVVDNDGWPVGGIASESSSPQTVVNNIVAFNLFTSISDDIGTRRDNCVYDGFGDDYDFWTTGPGPGDFSADPLFVNYAAGDYHLRRSSPCLDTGDSSIVASGWPDLDGNPRLLGDRVDRGAYESFATPPVFTQGDVMTALGIAGGLSTALPTSSRLDVDGALPAGVSMTDAVLLVRSFAGL